MTSEQEAELAQRRLQNAIAFDGGCVNSAKKVAFIDVLAENERLKEAIRRLADQDATLSVCEGAVTVEMDATLTDAERDDLRVWLAECLRQASIATEGANEELASRWQARATRAAAMIERLGGEK